MRISTHTKRRVATLAVIAGAMTALAPIGQAGSGSPGSPDAIPCARAQQAKTVAAIDARVEVA